MREWAARGRGGLPGSANASISLPCLQHATRCGDARIGVAWVCSLCVMKHTELEKLRNCGKVRGCANGGCLGLQPVALPPEALLHLGTHTSASAHRCAQHSLPLPLSLSHSLSFFRFPAPSLSPSPSPSPRTHIPNGSTARAHSVAFEVRVPRAGWTGATVPRARAHAHACAHIHHARTHARLHTYTRPTHTTHAHAHKRPRAHRQSR